MGTFHTGTLEAKVDASAYLRHLIALEKALLLYNTKLNEI